MLNKLQRNHGGFTLVEIMIVVAIIALLAAIAVPNFLRARKRSQATKMLEDLRILNDAVDQYAIDTNKSSGAAFGWPDLQNYVKTGTALYSAFAADGTRVNDLFGLPYCTGGVIDQAGGSGDVNLNRATFDALSDVADLSFWSPFGVQPGS